MTVFYTIKILYFYFYTSETKLQYSLDNKITFFHLSLISIFIQINNFIFETVFWLETVCSIQRFYELKKIQSLSIMISRKSMYFVVTTTTANEVYSEAYVYVENKKLKT